MFHLVTSQRFARADKRSKLPRWINQYITEAASNLSTDMALVLSKLFMRTISQNPSEKEATGISLWTPEDLKAHQEKLKAASIPATVVRRDDSGAMDVDEDEEDYDAMYGDGGITDQMMAGAQLDVLEAAPRSIDVF